LIQINPFALLWFLYEENVADWPLHEDGRSINSYVQSRTTLVVG
jgi:hypothetical protein